MKKSIFIVSLAMAFILTSCSSFLKLRTGDESLSYLKGEKKIGLEFDYSDMGVGSYPDEDKYVAEKVEEKNEKEAGSGDDWKEQWFGQREAQLEPEFEKLANKYVEDRGIYISRNNDNADYYVKVVVTHMEPGFNVGVVRKPAELSGELKVFKKGEDQAKSLYTFTKVPGSGASGYDFTVTSRLKQSYALLGKEFGKTLDKKMKSLE